MTKQNKIDPPVHEPKHDSTGEKKMTSMLSRRSSDDTRTRNQAAAQPRVKDVKQLISESR